MLKKLWKRWFGVKNKIPTKTTSTLSPGMQKLLTRPYPRVADCTPSSPEWMKSMEKFEVAKDGSPEWPIANEFMNDFLTPAFLLTQDVDPWDPNLTEEQKQAIIARCKVDPKYYFQKVISTNPPYRPNFPNPKTTDIPGYLIEIEKSK